MNTNSLLSEQILALSISEKLQLIEYIWDSLVVDADKIPLTQSQKQELDRRLASYQNLENQGESWEVVKQRILNNDI
ncbi:MAG: addiction module protein [Xenococcaceae cyanobacterium MO_234.B1]|nr:addiction module protein [Xenococcaceae cyanobacterium MO_234.B1]